MKKGIFYVLALLGAVCLVFGYWINPIGGLAGFVLSASGIVLEGIAIAILALLNRENKKSMFGILLLSGICFFFGGKDLILAGMDIAQGEKDIYLMDCNVSKGVSRRGIFTHYYLVGNDVQGEYRRFPINQSVYQEYLGKDSFSLEIIGWEHCEVIKEIR